MSAATAAAEEAYGGQTRSARLHMSREYGPVLDVRVVKDDGTNVHTFVDAQTGKVVAADEFGIGEGRHMHDGRGYGHRDHDRGDCGFGFGHGLVYGLHVGWSGNSRYAVERLPSGLRLLRGGELLLPGAGVLERGAGYTTPWVVLAAAIAISAGTYSGGFRIMRTLGRRVIQLTPAGGFAAQTVASGVMVTTATVFAVPVSTTHITTTSIMGVGATRRLSAVRWGVAGNIVGAWIVTLPAAGAVAAATYFLTHLVVG